MNTTEFYEQYGENLGMNFTKEELIAQLKIIPSFYLFDLICAKDLNFVYEAVNFTAQCMMEEWQEEKATKKGDRDKGNS